MKNQGKIIVSILFVLFASLLGIMLLSNTMLHLKIVRARNLKFKEMDCLYNSLIYYLHNFREKVFAYSPHFEDHSLEKYFSSKNFPDKNINKNQWMTHSFKFLEFPLRKFNMNRIIGNIDIHSSPKPQINYHLKSTIIIDILSGKIPLTFIPLVIDRKFNNSLNISTESLLFEKGIKNKSNKNVMVQDMNIEFNMADFLINALKIKEDKLNWRIIRETFGFPISDEPIPKGIHLLVKEDKIESIFIQGDVQQMLFTVEKKYQIISIFQDNKKYQLRFKPGGKFFVCWNLLLNNELLFSEKIIVNGNLWSMRQEKSPAFHPNANIQLVVSGKVFIHSNLMSKTDDSSQLEIKQKNISNLTLICSNKYIQNLQDSSSTLESSVIVANEEITHLQLSIIADGKFTNMSPKLKLTGSLYCKNIENKGLMEIQHASSYLSKSNEKHYFCTKNFSYLSNFLIQAIEEN